MFSFPDGDKDVSVPYEQTITDGKNINIDPWTVENPHPGFGKDPNILNEYGHTKFPMFVDSKIEFNSNGTCKRVIVNNDKELDVHTNSELKQFAALNDNWPT